ncbi:MAG: o-succinylbenzoate synthase [Okeania sp. SIO2G4]|uniref:o-succinylbenzoate synthase n=1 Tax=unclassified Okeania TaxID=2634635 RepID=UPI0013B8C78C|nr:MULTISPECIES: o-succinylbenzoate synthase [unclassified Okeania]NEP72831.1 o-succinylbenzoate synthase [Okeania sp. SIO2G5]NEP93618.1 o-succinylbenzoate synthase [Okeania sp. SIO2F5]NEQ91522.1 o-succinylbenzoate synthase [Okeania sp. SIO2G4]
MHYQLKFFLYKRNFKQPLKTSHGIWNIREGIILQLTSKTGKIGLGEIAPLSWFCSETLSEALDFCHHLPTEITVETILSIPENLPACKFGFESAWENLREREIDKKEELKNSNFYSALLPEGEPAIEIWKPLWQEGYRTFKWKIGVNKIQTEIQIFQQLVKGLPTEANLRLDANAGLTFEEAKQWLEICENLNLIEFIEQPLSVDKFEEMLKLSHQHLTPIALDESVANFSKMQQYYQQGWRGIFSIKPAIFGSPSQLRNFCQNHIIDVVFSSVFETKIGRKSALQLATELQPNILKSRAFGFGITHWFDEQEEIWQDNL